MSMRIDLHAKVRTRDGQDAGNVEGAVVDPSTNQIRELVVDKGGLLDRPRLVPFAEIAAASRDGDALRLRLTRAELDQLPTYFPERYVLPPAGWVSPLPYDVPHTAYLWPAAMIDAAPPLSSAAASPPTAGAPKTADIRMPKGTAVVDRDGSDIGVVDDVRLDPQGGQVTGFILRLGSRLRTFFGGGEVVEVTRSQIDRVDTDGVHLCLTKDELGRVRSSYTG